MQSTIVIFLNIFLITGTLSSPLNNEESKVAGDDAGKIALYPYLVAIKINDHNHNRTCTGAILDEKKVVTSAQCLNLNEKNDIDIQIVAGTDRPDDDGSNKVIRSVKSVIIHGGYSSEETAAIDKLKHYYNGIAIIEVDKPFDFNQSTTQPIMIPSQLKEANTECTVLGWSITETKENKNDMSNLNGVLQLQAFNISIVDEKPCSQVNKDNKVFFDEKTMFCAGHQTRNMHSQICYNETGSLLICNRELHGIAFHDSDPQCTNSINTPALFTKVSAYTEWFQENGIGVCPVKSVISEIIQLIINVIIPLIKWLIHHLSPASYFEKIDQ